MHLTPGTRLGPYEILAPVGAGGMGEVYRARDTKLGRNVALKILPDSFTHDPERVARFRREAQVLASLNHPHIAQIHGLEDANGTQFLVLELVDGESLDKRIARGPVPIDEALDIARQVAEGIEAAHETGIIHRDLKPANIAVSRGGEVKILDFGLAKATEAAAGTSVDLANSPTITSPAMMTGAGVILGTAAYMAPEQARGKAVDKRTDIWAFGCVLYEMLTGQKPFEGETLTDVVAAILKNEPNWQSLPRGTPIRVQSLIARCLRKDPAQRLHDIADGRFQIEEALQGSAGPAAVVSGVQNRREWVPWIVAAFAVGAALLLGARLPVDQSSGEPIVFGIVPPQNTVFSESVNTTVNVPSFALSHDGRDLVFSAQASGRRPMLWLRSFDQATPRELAGTEDAEQPFWSPDGRWIAFVASGTLKKVRATGLEVREITPAVADFRGGTWGSDDTILFARARNPISSVNAGGGPTTAVTAIDRARGESTQRYPYFLPDGRHFLYSISGSKPDLNGVYVGSLDDRATKKPLIHGNHANAVYASPGYLMFVDGDTLSAQAFDADRLEVKGQPFFVAEHVGRNSAFMSAVSASGAGTIAYAGRIFQNGRLTWFSRSGESLGPVMGSSEGDYTDFRLAPDETQLAASLVDPKSGAVEVWDTDLARHSRVRLATGGLISSEPLWSPDGRTVVFKTNRNGLVELYQMSAEGVGGNQPLLSQEDIAAAQIPSNNLNATDWSTDGQNIILSIATLSGYGLWVLPVGQNGRPARFINAAGDLMHGNFSPNGHLVAYTSNETGRFEVYVQTFPRPERKWPVSTNGGYEPRWRADGREIYYLSEDRTLMAVSVGAGPSFGIPKPLFQTRVPPGVRPNRTHYVPSGDGQRFLVNTGSDAITAPLTVVVNWPATLKK